MTRSKLRSKLIPVVFFQRNHSLFGSVWSSMKRGHGGFNRARSLKMNSTQIRISPPPSTDYIKAVTEGMNHITSMTKNVIVQNKANAHTMPHDDLRDEEIIPLRPLNMYNGDAERNYQVIE